jgi:tryptophan synthase alpha chain
VYNYGVERFVARAAAAGAAALIVPDLPVESDEGLLAAAHAAGIGVIQVAAPGAGAERIGLLAERTDGVLYVTARRGITGGATMIGADTQEWINLVKAYCAKPIALGFGIRNAEQVNALKGLVPVVVAGSCFVERIGALQPDEDAEKALAAFARDLMG